MEKVINTLRSICHQLPNELNNVPQSLLLDRPEGKWSKLEILGHLCDSAMVNIQRFVRAQADVPPRISYDQDRFVAIQQYQSYDMQELVTLWHSLNKHLLHLALHADKDTWSKIYIGSHNEELTLEYLFTDYVDHLQHHVKQIID
ncbi:DinB family protein [Mucilaginibacter daejeonensis]|uniref:DinB family protein n=1 Tax=Mucilaginibacter daejeonensis TaxID=398049 RepID=UPI001D1710EE|nr:DinB family protein [Mucilaginibacter daejeonensis]UEG54613.1 DinB family protein [Mucilaginibacter daejeonensis]